MKLSFKFLAGIGLLFSLQCYGQNFGGNPSSIKWKQVNTSAGRIIFPKGMDSAAFRVATLTEALNERHRATVGNALRKIDVILNSNNTISNAFVQLAPYRSEYYLTQPQDPFNLGSLGWVDNLAIHEFRHVQQYSNYNRGLSRAARFILGEQGQALFNAMSVPDWFFEGDAVWNETAVSQQGRGRLPFFFNGYKSLFLEQKNYSFLKLRNGSLRSYVPNHYDYGYLMVTYGREKYGDSVWNAITHDAAAFKHLFYPLQKAMQSHIHIDYDVFRREAFQYYQHQWQQEKATTPDWLTKIRKGNVTDYKYVYPAGTGSMIALKTSYRQVPTFVKLDSLGREEKIAVRDIGYDDYYSYRNGRIVYPALQPDIRWANRDYSVIRLLDVNTREVRTISSKTKFYSPDINEAGDMIVLAEADPSKHPLLKIIDLDGKLLRSFTADSSLFYSHPKFSTDGKSVFAAARTPAGEMGLMEWRLDDNQFRWLLAPGPRIIGFPVVMGEQLFFTISTSGKDGVCRIDLPAGTPVKLADYPTGIYQGYATNGRLIGSVFTSGGYRLASFPIANAGKGTTITGYEVLKPMYVQRTFAGEENVTALSTKSYEVKKFSKGFKLLNFHSRQPDINNPDYSITLLSENVLGTFGSELSYTYNKNEASHKAAYTGIFGGSYIQPFINISQTWGREVAYNRDTTFLYNESEAAFGLLLPLNLSYGKQYRRLSLQTAINTDRVRWTGVGKKLLQGLDFNYWSARISYTGQIQQAVQHIYPRFAQTFLADYKMILNKYTARQVLLTGSLYFPGLFVNHNIVVNAAFQERDTLQQYIFDNSFPFSRGYNGVNFPRMWKLGANYHLPLWYPDWGFGSMLYFRRLRLNMFYDYTDGISIRTGIHTPFSTAGTELFIDTKVWNQLPVTFGIRYSRLLDKEYRGVTQPNQWEIILPVNLY